MAKVKVATKSELTEGKIKKVVVGKEPVALFNVGGDIFATSNICTHEECHLDENHKIEGEEVECTCHGSRFNIKTGANTLPPATEPLKTYQVSFDGEDVFIDS